jgi:nucleotide-binding universal stress UspA family protein
MHKLLVPVDSSDNAIRALEHAIRLAKENGPMELVIVYAHEPPIIYGEIEIYLSEEKANEMLRGHSEDILSQRLRRRRMPGSRSPAKS